MESTSTPRVSVVVTSFLPLKNVMRCLESLLAQNVAPGTTEIVLAWSASARDWQTVAEKFPGVRAVPASASDALPELLGQGVARARGEIIALTDASCTAPPDWIAAMEKAHRADHQIIGGAVAMKRGRALDWAAFFCEYGQFLPPLPGGQSAELPGNNLSFQRRLLEQSAEFTRPQFWKTYWCRALQSQGVALFSAPDIVVFQNKSYRLTPFLRRRFQHGRCFAGMRLRQLSALRRAAYIAGAPLLPLVFGRRVVKAVWPKRAYRAQFVRALPFSALAILFWCAGEWCGYLAGPGGSCAHVRG